MIFLYLQIEALEAILERERSDAKARNSRQKLTVERLRQQIVELQVSPCSQFKDDCS